MIFSIDIFLNSKIVPLEKLEVCELDMPDLKDLFKEYEVNNIEDLQREDWDRIYFKSEHEADKFLIDYKNNFNRILNENLCHSRDLPALAYRRRMLPLALMGKKMMTSRDYKANLKEGELFNLHDRTYFLTVRLNKIQFKKGLFEYHFELP